MPVVIMLEGTGGWNQRAFSPAKRAGTDASSPEEYVKPGLILTP
ncbi:MAG: hypothetical protein WBY44_21165 [Bryobacteraceae bacterium]